ncbi:MAG: fused MFS/spermidine synthase, partial [Planctomycetes bacterium]|nr:fused MFS/spermidine synthase [Planctomycetota bacterium]
MFLLFALSFALSGVCALTYQVAWARLFIGEFGATSGATATVLAAFMGGLALGSLFFGRVADRTRHPLRLYGLLECAVGAFALALPGLLDLAGPYLQDLLAPAAASAATAGLAAPHSVARALRFVVAFLLLLPPTVCMGGTFPVLAAAWGGGEGRGARWAFLYGTNTLGAALGALLSGFWWIGAWGVQGTVEAAAWMNVGVGLLAVGGAALVARGTGETTVAPPARRAPGENPTAPPARRGPGGSLYLLIGAAALLGFVGLSLEVVWHRILGVIVVNTSYSFSILLTVFLAALALGSAAASVAMHLGARPRSLLGTVVQLLGCGILLGMLLLRHPNTAPGTHLSSLGGELWNQYLSGIWLDAFLALFVPAFCLGMAFPLLCAEAAAARERSRGLAVGGITAANTVGAVAGSLLTGFVLIPWIGDFQSLLASLAVLATLLGLLLVREAGGWRRVRPAVVGLALLSVFALEYQHLPDSRALTVGNGMLGGKRGERMVCVDYREGASLTVGVLQSRDAEQRRVLYTNSFAMAGTGPDYAYMRMLAHLPMMSVPAAENACVIGFGTGTTAGTLSLYPLRSLDIVEIAPEVVEMAKWFERENHGIALRLAHAPDAHSSMAGGGSASEDGALASRADPTGAASIVEIVDRFPESPSDRREPAQPGTRLRLIVEDGAHFLRTTRQQYDVITAEPPLPALAGSANLYGTDFYRAALDRLTPGGVVCQWVPLHGLSPGDFKMLVRTFARSFPHASLWYFREAAVLLGGRRSWNFDPYWMTAAMSLDRIEADLREIDAADPYAILSSFVCADRSLLAFAGE